MIRWECKREEVDAQLALDVESILEPDQDTWSVYFGWRSCTEQDKLFEAYKAGGPRAAPPGESAHENCLDDGTPSSLALDVVCVRNGIEIWDYEDAAWKRLWAMCKAHPRLHSGHEFPTDTHNRVGPDDDHIESVKWFVRKIQLQQEGKWGKCAEPTS